MMKTLEMLAGMVYYMTACLEEGERAKLLAESLNLRLELLYPKEPLPTDAVSLVIALDYLWLSAEGRRLCLADLVENPPKIPTYLHSFDFQQNEEEQRFKNVILRRHLDKNLLLRAAGLMTAEDAAVITGSPGALEAPSLDEDELARIRLGSDGSKLCD